MTTTSPVSSKIIVPPSSEAGPSSSSTSSPSNPRSSMPSTSAGGLASRTAPEDGTGPRRTGAVIGVMGGMGPAAANQFGQLLIDLKTGAKTDQQHARVLLDQATDIPDRTAAILRGGASPIKNLEESLKRLDRGGADLVAVTCNTAHHFFNDMQQAIDKFDLKLSLVHIVDAAMKELEAQKPGAKRIGLLATSGALQTKVYENRAAELKLDKEWVYPNPQTQEKAVMRGIYDGVKKGNNELGRELLLQAAQELKDKGVDAILLACTEIPLVLKKGDMKGADGKELPLIDTLGSLAKESLARADSMPGRVGVETPRGTFTVKLATGLSSFVQQMSVMLLGEPERPRRIGVMGGMGPAAAMQFSDYMVKFNPEAKTDQQHVKMVVDQATDIPDRTAAILTGGRSPVEEIGKSLKRLAAAGADDIVMTCNTVHYFFPQMQEIINREKLKVNMIHVVDATMKLLDQQAPGAQNIGLLATSGTVNTGVYQNHACAAGRQWMTPSAQTQEQQVMAGIYKGVKVGGEEGMKLGRNLLKAAAQELADKGADAILLACTEIPLVLKTGDIKNKDGKVIPLIDTLEAQAREAISRARVPVPATPGIVQQVMQLLFAPTEDHLAAAPSAA